MVHDLKMSRHVNSPLQWHSNTLIRNVCDSSNSNIIKYQYLNNNDNPDRHEDGSKLFFLDLKKNKTHQMFYFALPSKLVRDLAGNYKYNNQGKCNY